MESVNDGPVDATAPLILAVYCVKRRRRREIPVPKTADGAQRGL
jgi:hypothetical protein